MSMSRWSRSVEWAVLGVLMPCCLAIQLFVGNAVAANSSLVVTGRVADPIDRPALISSRSAQSVVLHVVRAGNRLVAVGERGMVMLSDDNGLAWRQAKVVPVAVTLTRAAFVSDKVGWTVGHSGVILHSTDGGETWVRQLDGKTASALVAKAAEKDLHKNPGDANAQRRVQEAQRLVQDGADKPFLDLYFSDTSNGFVIGAYGLMFRTEDGGKSWQPWMAMVENPNGLHLNAIAFAHDAIYIVGERGLVLRAESGVDKFVAVKTPYAGSYFVVGTVGASVVIGGLRGNAFASADRGRTWASVEVPIPVTLTDATLVADGARVFVNQAGQLLVSNDAAVMRPLLLQFPAPLTSVVQAADGSLVATSFRGVHRLPPIAPTISTIKRAE